jgi:hypothetical protein
LSTEHRHRCEQPGTPGSHGSQTGWPEVSGQLARPGRGRRVESVEPRHVVPAGHDRRRDAAGPPASRRARALPATRQRAARPPTTRLPSSPSDYARFRPVIRWKRCFESHRSGAAWTNAAWAPSRRREHSRFRSGRGASSDRPLGMDEEHPRHQALRPGVLHRHRVRALTSRAFPLTAAAFAIAW